MGLAYIDPGPCNSQSICFRRRNSGIPKTGDIVGGCAPSLRRLVAHCQCIPYCYLRFYSLASPVHFIGSFRPNKVIPRQKRRLFVLVGRVVRSASLCSCAPPQTRCYRFLQRPSHRIHAEQEKDTRDSRDMPKTGPPVASNPRSSHTLFV